VKDDRLSAYIDAMRQAAEDAVAYKQGLSHSEFLADKRTQHAVALNFMIIGKCAGKILSQFAEFAESRHDLQWIKMRGMRNQVAHAYSDMNLDIVWDTVQNSLPELITKLGDHER
jgi:uncharacterized protein with HEPN domain